MKVLFITPYGPEGPSSRFRVWQYLPYLEPAGIQATVSPLLTTFFYRRLYRRGNLPIKILALMVGIGRRLLDLVRARCYDIVFVQREAFPVGPAAFEWLLGRIHPRLVFDFDDAIFIPRTSDANRRWLFLKSPNKLAANIRRARLVFAGNGYLARYAQPLNPRVVVLPTPVDTERFCPAPGPRPDQPLIIGWLGSRTTSGYLALVEQPLARLLAQYPNRIRIRLVGADDFRFAMVPAEYLSWQAETEVGWLHSFDIGIMPMPDDEWTRGKCGYKALQYLSVGIPAVCSDVGVNSEIIDDGGNGFLVRTEAEWYEKLALLLENPALRQRMGAAGIETVTSRYALVHCAERMAQELEGLCR